MSKTHNVKVNFDITAINYFCPLCVYATKSMAELKNHLVSDHNKEKHDWMVQEIKAEFSCAECVIEFPRRSLLVNHMDKFHNDDRGNTMENNEARKEPEQKEDLYVKCVTESYLLKLNSQITSCLCTLKKQKI